MSEREMLLFTIAVQVTVHHVYYDEPLQEQKHKHLKLIFAANEIREMLEFVKNQPKLLEAHKELTTQILKEN